MNRLKYVFLGILLSAPAAAHAAPGGLLVSPTRVVIEGRERAVELSLMNTGTEKAVYRLSWAEQYMDTKGNHIPVTEPTKFTELGVKPASSFVRFSPRQVELPPGTNQTVRLVLRRPNNLAAGEYRSHLEFASIPSSTGNTLNAVADDKKNLRVQLVPIFKISIPVIVRHAATEAAVAMESVAFDPGKPSEPGTLKLRLTRDGNRSVYGDFKIYFQPEKELEPVLIAQLKGCAVYTPTPFRDFTFKLDKSKLTSRKGRLKIVFENAEQRSGVLAEGGVNIQL